MTSTSSEANEALVARYLPAIALGVVLSGAALVAWRVGGPAVILWLAFCALSGAVLLFWESVRSALDKSGPAEGEDDPDVVRNARSELESRKRAALRALKDIQFEYSIGRLSDVDYRELEVRYRAEARSVMVELDSLLGEHLARAEVEFDQIARDATALEPVAGQPAAQDEANDISESPVNSPAEAVVSVTAPVRPLCAACQVDNETDAKFCKGCGAAMTPSVSKDNAEVAQ
ncbi:MAG: zinc ribbon domain-containing protein [Deltaproteobacteria bacterium]|nr:zinc ribbon domain-containing protein [Deltaproteobacteria bacterium]